MPQQLCFAPQQLAGSLPPVWRHAITLIGECLRRLAQAGFAWLHEEPPVQHGQQDDEGDGGRRHAPQPC